MKVISFIVSAGVLAFSLSASECKPIVDPRDFQLDKKLIIGGESQEFIDVTHWYLLGYLEGTAQGLVCDVLIRPVSADDIKYQGCAAKFSKAINFRKIMHEKLGRQLDEYAYKTSPLLRISKDEICDIQNSYDETIDISKSSILQSHVSKMLKSAQENAHIEYAKLYKSVGSSTDGDEILNAIMNQ